MQTDRMSSGQIFVQMLIWVRQYWFSYSILILFVLSASWIPVLWAESMKRLFNAASAASLEQLWSASALLAGVFLMEIGADALRASVSQRLFARSTLRMQKAILERLFSVRLARLAGWHTGEKLQRINDSAVEAQNGMNQRIPQALGQVLEIIFLLAYLTYLSLPLLAGALAVGLLLPLLGNLYGRPIHKWQTSKNEAQGVQDARLMDILQGNEVIRAYGLRGYVLRLWKADAEETRKRHLRLGAWQIASEWSGWIGFWLGQFYLLSMGAWLVHTGRTDIGSIAAFMISYERLVFPLGNLVNQWAVLQNTLAHARRVLEMVNPNAPLEKASPQLEELPGDIVFDRVTFAYSPEGVPALREFSTVFPKGKTTALVGPSGSGKSTVLKLLLGLYEPNAGEIRIGEAKPEPGHSFRLKKVAYVPQHPFLFSGTVRENIAMGMDVSDEELVHACRLARADSFIERLPDRYETMVLDRGENFSGGERQRISIARAYLRKPELLLLDEPTSALDRDNERLVRESLKSLMAGRTVVVIAHRLSTVRDADQIVFVSEGRVLGTGTHDELMATCAEYAELILRGEWADEADEQETNAGESAENGKDAGDAVKPALNAGERG